ncbi:MAG TPA: sigma-70 family RNA polymerase sigma factor [Polyangiaceae bacterium]|nr:sigma-70 family RNA polymerase sigma factor [Polyangiaceae bacterium]
MAPRNPGSSASDDAAELTALARLAGSGDPAATRRFLDQVWPTLSRVVSSVLGSRHPEVDDVIQQSLIAVLQALSAFRGDCHPAGYASRIALHVALRARRNAALRRARSETLAQISASDPNAEWPAAEASAERRKKALRDLLADLPEEQADALALRIMLGWSLEEVAQATGAPLNTVRSRVRLAKEALRRRIEADPTLADELEVAP